MSALLSLSRLIDAISMGLGKLVMWLILAATTISAEGGGVRGPAIVNAGVAGVPATRRVVAISTVVATTTQSR